MKILLIGNGGREHALAWKIKQSPLCDELHCTPSSAGIESLATAHNVGAEDIDGILGLITQIKPDFVVVGPEAPLVAGLADRIDELDIPCFGPNEKAAQLEGSKAFMKDLCAAYDIPTAIYKTFTEVEGAYEFLDGFGQDRSETGVVIKADGLAAGKGVIIPNTMDEARAAVSDMLSGNKFGQAGSRVIIEEFLPGEELSFFALTDGASVVPLTTAQDHKRAFDGDKGPNTGGMGAYSPAHMMTPELEAKIMDTIITPTVNAMKDKGCPFQGVLYAGIILVAGEPKLLEYNIRFGDPECQPLMMRFTGDLVKVLYACATGTLADAKDEMKWIDDVALCVVMAANGYPESYAKNTVINGLDQAGASENTVVFHAGTKRDDNGNVVNTGGRTLGVTATGSSFAEAQDNAYSVISNIDWPDGFCRKDIGWRAIAAQNKKNAA